MNDAQTITENVATVDGGATTLTLSAEPVRTVPRGADRVLALLLPTKHVSYIEPPRMVLSADNALLEPSGLHRFYTVCVECVRYVRENEIVMLVRLSERARARVNEIVPIHLRCFAHAAELLRADAKAEKRHAADGE